MTSPKWNYHERAAVLLLLLAGAVLPMLQLLFNRSLWTDEAAVAMSIVQRGFAGLLEPLEYLQVAPILYLWLVKAGSLLVTDSEIGLRLPSYLAYLGTLALFFLFLRRHMGSGLAVAAGLAIFVFNNRLLFYGTELKQYMFEALVSMALIYILFSDWEERRKMVASAVVGCLSVGLSITFAMILPAVMLYFVLAQKGRWDRSFVMRVFALGLCWLAVFVPYYMAFLNDHPYLQNKQEVFEAGFPPPVTQLKQYLHFLLYSFSYVFKDFGFSGKNLGYPPFLSEWPNFLLMAFLLILGFIRAFRKDRLFVVLLVPILLHVVMTSLKLYPMVNRLFLHAYPILALLISMGVDALLSGEPFKKPMAASLFTAILLFFGVLFVNSNYPKRMEEAKEVLKGVSAASKPGDGIHLYPASIAMVEYYRHIGVYRPTGRVVASQSTTQEGWIGTVSEHSVNHAPFWLFFAHFKKEDERNTLDKLDSLGMRLADSVKAFGASAYRVVPKQE
jgi:hypothetical protein